MIFIRKARNNIRKQYEEEERHQTQTLWDNEVEANLFVARILFYTAILSLSYIVVSFSARSIPPIRED